MVKKAQTWGMFLPAHRADSARSFHEGMRTLARDAADKARRFYRGYTLEDTARYNPGPNDDSYYNILVGGANSAGRGLYGMSYLPFGVASKGDNKELFRWSDGSKIRRAIEKALAKGKRVRVFGHSYGGATVAGIAKRFPKVPFYALDPVSYTGRLDRIPSNLTILQPKEGWRDAHENWMAKMAPVVGGRWPRVKSQPERYVEYEGGHVDGLDEAVNRIIHDEMAKERAPRG